MLVRLACIFFCTVTLIGGCDATQGVYLETPVAFVKEWPPGSFGIRTRERLVIRSSAEWRKRWDAEHEGVDFAQHQVLVASMGEQPHGGDEIRIVEVVQLGDDLEVRVRETLAPPGMPVPAVISYPSHVVAVPKTSGRVRFVDR
jgi:hypothetical protein